jgi:hypothetical protein
MRDGFTQPDGLPAVPLVLGVVGHRDVRDGDREALRTKLIEVFQQFRQAYRHSPLVVMTSLAEGADQIAAEAALACEGLKTTVAEGMDPNDSEAARKGMVFVRAPLPFALDVYRRSTSFDPKSEDGQRRLNDLLKDPRVECFEVPLPEGKADDKTDWVRVATEQEDGPEKRLRHICYANAGAYLVLHCHALVALWDGPEGSPSRGPSGTAEHVALKLKGRPPALYPWTDDEPLGFRSERGPVLVVHTPRAKALSESAAGSLSAGDLRVFVPGHDAPLKVPPKLLPLAKRLTSSKRFWDRVWASLGFRPGLHESFPEDEAERTDSENRRIDAELHQFRETCTTVDDFNRDIKRPAVVKGLRTRRLKNEESLLAPYYDDVANAWLLRLSRVREAAAEVTNYLQPRQSWALGGVFVLLGLSLLAFHLYAHLEPRPGALHPFHTPAFLGIFLVLLLAAAFVVAWAWRTRLEERRLDSRALAEALRVRRAWAMAGVGRSVADSYIRQLRGEVSWIRQAVLHVSPPARTWAEHFNRLEEEQQLAMLRLVRETWIRGGKNAQIPQFERRHKDEHGRAIFLRLTGFLFALAGWFALLVLFLAGLRASEEPDEPTPAALPLVLASSGGATPKPDRSRGEPSKSSPERLTPERLTPVHPPVWLLIGSSLLVIVGGLIVGYCERGAHEELSKQFEQMLIVFQNGDHELETHLDEGDVPHARKVIEELGREAILEHAQWLILRRTRSLELHLGG